MKTVKIVAFALVVGLAMSAGAAPKYYAKLTASGYSGESTLANFPVLVRISPEKISGFSYDDCAANGADISFKGADGTTLAHEIDTWNTAGESLVWVNLPSLTASTTFTMRWGDSDVTVSTSTNATWNDDYVGVWHMGEAEAGSTCANSTSKGSKYDAVPQGTTANSRLYDGTDAPVGGARTTASRDDSSTTPDYLSVASYDAEGVGGTFTMSGWLRLSYYDYETDKWPRLFSRKVAWNTEGGWESHFESFPTNFSVRGKTQKAKVLATQSHVGEWAHYSLVYNGTSCTVYVNGESIGTATLDAAATDNDHALGIGNIPGASSYKTCRAWGAFDECRLMKGAASADWVKAEYDTAKKSDFLSCSAVQSLETGLSVCTPRVTRLCDNSADVAVCVAGLGAGATKATISIAYGFAADALARKVSKTVDSASLATLTLTRLVPGDCYYAVTVRNDLGASVTFPVGELTPPSPDVATVPGIYQALFSNAPDSWSPDCSALPEGTNFLDYADSGSVYRRELGVLAAYAGTNNVGQVSAIWGGKVYWPTNGVQWVYWGYVYLQAGKRYKFKGRTDDCIRLQVKDPSSGEVLHSIEALAWNKTALSSSALVPTTTGWYPIEVRLRDTGTDWTGACVWENGSCLLPANLGYSSDNGATWSLLIDPGDASLLSARVSPVIMAEESVRTLDLSFAAAQNARTLAVVWGPRHGGETTNGWAHAEVLGTVAAGETKYSYAVASMSDAWGSDANLVVRFCFVGLDPAPQWSNSTYWRATGAKGFMLLVR